MMLPACYFQRCLLKEYSASKSNLSSASLINNISPYCWALIPKNECFGTTTYAYRPILFQMHLRTVYLSHTLKQPLLHQQSHEQWGYDFFFSINWIAAVHASTVVVHAEQSPTDFVIWRFRWSIHRWRLLAPVNALITSCLLKKFYKKWLSWLLLFAETLTPRRLYTVSDKKLKQWVQYDVIQLVDKLYSQLLIPTSDFCCSHNGLAYLQLQGFFRQVCWPCKAYYYEQCFALTKHFLWLQACQSLQSKLPHLDTLYKKIIARPSVLGVSKNVLFRKTRLYSVKFLRFLYSPLELVNCLPLLLSIPWDVFIYVSFYIFRCSFSTLSYKKMIFLSW